MLFVIVIVVSWASSSYLPATWFPWWSFAVPCALAGLLFGKSRKHAFGSGFWGLFLLWGLWVLVIDIQNGGLLAVRMAELFQLPSRWLLAIITAVVGGLGGGLATWSGYALRRL